MYVILRSVPRNRNISHRTKHEFVGIFSDEETALKETVRLDIRQPFFEYKVIQCEPDTIPDLQTIDTIYDKIHTRDTFPDIVREEELRKQESAEQSIEAWNSHVHVIKKGYVIDKLQILHDTVSWFRNNSGSIDKRRSGEIRDIMSYFDTIDVGLYLDKDQMLTLSEIKSDAFIFSNRD